METRLLAYLFREIAFIRAEVRGSNMPKAFSALAMGNVKKRCGILNITRRRSLAGEGDTDSKLGILRIFADRDTATYDAPNFILRLSIVVRSQLPGHWYRQQNEPAAFYMSFETKTRSKSRNIAQPRDLIPTHFSVHPDLDTYPHPNPHPPYSPVVLFDFLTGHRRAFELKIL